MVEEEASSLSLVEELASDVGDFRAEADLGF